MPHNSKHGGWDEPVERVISLLHSCCLIVRKSHALDKQVADLRGKLSELEAATSQLQNSEDAKRCLDVKAQARVHPSSASRG